MIIFKFVLIMLAAVLVSNLINRYIPALSAPLVQIALGVIISLIPFGAFGFEFELESDLFFVLFIAPLVFHASYTSDKKTLWNMKKQIFGAAVWLVFLTVAAVGYLTNFLIPAIPLAAAFALIGALGPTDDVAVDAVAKRIAVPRKIMGILSGESIINDASGIICFQFAIIAMTTGSFSLKHASFQFVLLGIGGLLAGILMTLIKYIFINRLKASGIRNVTLSILFEVLTPFIVYMAAEALSVSGILAVFSAGITHSFMRDKFNPETVKLNIARDSVWEFLTFTLDGLVFVMLGTQLPSILKTISNLSISPFAIAGIALLITVIFLILRFLWWLITIRKKSYQEEDSPISAVKAAVIFSLAGARGTVTLASVMSIPLMLDNGTEFPERDLIILLASGVIVISMLITNFILPLFVRRISVEGRSNKEQAAHSEIIEGVISRLKNEATDENRLATEIVIRNYAKRNAAERGGNLRYIETQIEKELRARVSQWMKENTAALIENGKADKTIAEHFINVINTRSNKGEGKHNFSRGLFMFIKHALNFRGRVGIMDRRVDFENILVSNTQYAIEKLNEIKNKENAAAVEKLIAEYELMSALGRNHIMSDSRLSMEDSPVHIVVKRGFSIERELIQEMFEANRISREAAKEMRTAILTLETQLQSDY